MQLDSDEVRRAFPWVKELWLFAPGTADVDLLVVSAVPPREVPPGQRQRLLAQLQGVREGGIDLRLTTTEQLAKWLAQGGRFASIFRRQAVKLFERSPGVS